MTIYIDADGCPVVSQAIDIAKEKEVTAVIVCDSAHEFRINGVQVICVSKGVDSADFAILNRMSKGDIIVTQDYGLAALVLTRGGFAIDQNGRLYEEDTIDSLLDSRYLSAMARRAGYRTKGPKARTKEQNRAFHAHKCYFKCSKSK